MSIRVKRGIYGKLYWHIVSSGMEYIAINEDEVLAAVEMALDSTPVNQEKEEEEEPFGTS